jgi:hypothetical protein
MSVAEIDTREGKLKWLLRPAQLASSLSFFAAIFGFVYWHFGIYSAETVAVALIAAMAVNAVLLIWAVGRISNVVRGRF